MAFHEFLYALRKEKGLTQVELAELLGVTNKAVSKWETGEAMPETALLKPLAQTLGVTVDELLGGKRAESAQDGAAQEDPQGHMFRPNEKSVDDEIRAHMFTRGKDEEKTLAKKICDAVTGCMWLGGIVAYFIASAFTGLWHPLWVMFPVGAFLSGIIGIIADRCSPLKRAARREKGKNGITDGVCGIVMLSCFIAYILLGGVWNMWHPYWLIPLCGVFVCAMIGSIGKVIDYKKRPEKIGDCVDEDIDKHE